MQKTYHDWSAGEQGQNSEKQELKQLQKAQTFVLNGHHLACAVKFNKTTQCRNAQVSADRAMWLECWKDDVKHFETFKKDFLGCTKRTFNNPKTISCFCRDRPDEDESVKTHRSVFPVVWWQQRGTERHQHTEPSRRQIQDALRNNKPNTEKQVGRWQKRNNEKRQRHL